MSKALKITLKDMPNNFNDKLLHIVTENYMITLPKSTTVYLDSENLKFSTESDGHGNSIVSTFDHKDQFAQFKKDLKEAGIFARPMNSTKIKKTGLR